MNNAILIISILLIIGSIIMIVVSAVKGDKNQTNLQGSNVYSFTMPYWKPDNSSSVTSSTPSYGTGTSSQGTTTLTCPAGKTIKTIGAYFSIYDPYGQCVDYTSCNAQSGGCNAPLNIIVNSCDPNSSISKMLISTCANTCETDSTKCSSMATGKFQFANPMCSSFGTGIQPSNSNIYSGQGEAFCIPSRDISAFVADITDGQQSITLNAADVQTGKYGPLPCILADVTTNFNSMNNYNQLPNIPLLTHNSNGDIIEGLPKQGYTIHGVYACI